MVLVIELFEVLSCCDRHLETEFSSQMLQIVLSETHQNPHKNLQKLTWYRERNLKEFLLKSLKLEKLEFSVELTILDFLDWLF